MSEETGRRWNACSSSQSRWGQSYLRGSQCKVLSHPREDHRVQGQVACPELALTRLGPDQSHRKAGLGWMGHLCCFVRDEGLDQGTNHSGTSSDSSAWQEALGWGRFRYRYPGLHLIPYTTPLHSIKRPPWVSSPGKAGRCLSPGAGLAGWPCPGHPHLQLPRWVSSQHGAGQEEGGRGPEAKHWRWQPCCLTLPRPSWAARFRARRAEAGCLYLAGQPEPKTGS